LTARLRLYLALCWTVLLSCGLTATHGASASGVSAVDARGKRVTLPALPRRIVSLTPANTEILFALGLKGRIVADTTYCDYPPEAKTLPHVGDSNISIEKVIAQKPDLVVASASASKKAIEQLERLGSRRIPVFAVDPKNMHEVYAAIRSIGQITGQTRQAEQVARSMQARVARVRKAVASARSRPRVLVVVQADPLWVVGSENFMDELIRLAGGENATRDAGPGYHAYSVERVVVRKPDVILIGHESAARIRSKPGWSNLPAVQRNALYAPDPNKFSRPGPRLAEALEELARMLHPQAFPARTGVSQSRSGR